MGEILTIRRFALAEAESQEDRDRFASEFVQSGLGVDLRHRLIKRHEKKEIENTDDLRAFVDNELGVISLLEGVPIRGQKLLETPQCFEQGLLLSCSFDLGAHQDQDVKSYLTGFR